MDRKAAMAGEGDAQEARRREAREQRAAQRHEKHNRHMARRRATSLPDVAGIVAQLQARPAGNALESYAERVVMKRGEDGITVELFRRIGLVHHRAVDIGCGSHGGKAGILVAGLACSALLLDGDAELVEICRGVFAGYPARVEQAWITRESVNELLAAPGFDRDLDYLGIGIDGVDYWIWEALTVRPRLVRCEYNPLFGPEAAVTVPYSPDFSRRARHGRERARYPKGYFGASLAALEHLARCRDYRMVVTSPGSPNAFFLRNDVGLDVPAISAADGWGMLTKHGAKKQKKIALLYEEIRRAGVERHFTEHGWPLVAVGE